MRRSSVYLCLTAGGVLLLGLLLGIFPKLAATTTTHRLITERQLVHRLGLTDICLFTEAPYTRHPSLADRFAPFQDHPLATTHFPSGSVLGPPDHLTGSCDASDSMGTEP